MPSNFEILIQARDQASATIKSIDGALAQLDNTAKKTSGSFEQAGSRSENYGRALARGVQIASNSLDILAPAIGKISPALDSAIRSVQQFGGAMSLAFSFGGPGIAIAAITTALGVLVQALSQQAEATAGAIRNNDIYIGSMRELGEADKTAASKIRELADVMAQQQDRLSITHLLFGEQEQSLGTLNSILSVFGQHIEMTAEKIARIKAALDAMKFGFRDSYDEVERARAGMGAFGISVQDTTQKILTAVAALDAFAASAAVLQKYTVDAYNARLETDTLITADHNLQMTLLDVVSSEHRASDAAAAHKLAMEAEKRAAEALANAIKSIASGLIARTEVTAEDMAAAQAGKYVDKWDEAARRMKDIQNLGGASPWAQPANWGNITPPPGLLEAIGKGEQALKDFAAAEVAAFYGGQRLNEINLAAWDTQIEKAVNDAIGQFELLAAAEAKVKDYLTTLSQQDPSKYQRFLKAEGISAGTSIEGAAKKLFDTMTGADAQQSEKLTDDIATNIQAIAGDHIANIKVQKDPTFDANLQEILDDLAKIPDGYDVQVTIHYTSAAAPGGSENTAGAVPSTENVHGVAAQHGASFTVPPGFNENFPIRASSGEQVLILPATMTESELDYFIKQNMDMLVKLYNANPDYWMGIAAQHPGWSRLDWYNFIFGGGGFKLSELGIPAGGGGMLPGKGATGDSYHGPVYKAPVQYSFTVYPRDYEDLMRQARAAAAHGA